MKSICIRSFSGLYFPVFALNAGKYGPEKFQTRTIFTQCLLLVKKRSDQGTRNHQQIIFRKVWTIHTQNSDQRSIFEYDDEIEVKLPFFTDLSQHFGIYLMTFAITIFIHGEKVT